MNYPILSLIFLAAAAIVLLLALALHTSRRSVLARWWAPVLISGAVVMTLTAVFDNVMIRAGIVAYAPGQISGILVGVAPLEDFAYPLAGLMLLPSLWLLLGRRRSHARD